MTDKPASKSAPEFASGRKDAHLDLARKTLAEGQQSLHPLEAVELPYCALPELDLAEIVSLPVFCGASYPPLADYGHDRRHRTGRCAECCIGRGRCPA